MSTIDEFAHGAHQLATTAATVAEVSEAVAVSAAAAGDVVAAAGDVVKTSRTVMRMIVWAVVGLALLSTAAAVITWLRTKRPESDIRSDQP